MIIKDILFSFMGAFVGAFLSFYVTKRMNIKIFILRYKDYASKNIVHDKKSVHNNEKEVDLYLKEVNSVLIFIDENDPLFTKLYSIKLYLNSIKKYYLCKYMGCHSTGDNCCNNIINRHYYSMMSNIDIITYYDFFGINSKKHFCNIKKLIIFVLQMFLLYILSFVLI